MTEPMTPPESDLKDFSFTPMYRARLFGSAFHARASDGEWRAGVTLWLKSQDQVPAGSLPDDDVDLCRLAELGRDTKTWKKLKAGALRGWIKCTDGRLYHQVVAEITLRQWIQKLEQRKRTIKARLAALAKRVAATSDRQQKADLVGSAQEMQQEELRIISGLSQAAEYLARLSVTDAVTATKREGEGEGYKDSFQVSKNSEDYSLGAGGDPARPADPDPAVAAGKPRVIAGGKP
jgi:hypothetical protein